MAAALLIIFLAALLVLAFFAPRLSRHAEKGDHGAIDAGRRIVEKAPEPVRRPLAKMLERSDRYVSKAGRAGREGRGKTPG